MTIPTALAQIGIPALLEMIGKGLESTNSPLAKQAGSVVKSAGDMISGGKMSIDELKEAHRHDKDKTQIMQINESLRTEAASNDWYVRRMRPTFGYIMAITWGAQMLALAYTVVFEPAQAGAILNGMESLGLIWSVGLSVLGIYVYKRSEEKRLTR